MDKSVLQINNLKVAFKTEYGQAKAVNGISFEIQQGKVLGIVGESGCGKSVTAMSILGLLPKNASLIEGGIFFNNDNITDFTENEYRKIRGNQIALIPQDPLTSLNPLYTIGDQVMEVLKVHKKLKRGDAELEAISLLDKVKIPQPEVRIHEYPHQLSGGMRQRVLIAMALSCSPKLLIADEPTTALDVTIQAQIIKLIRELLSAGTSSMLLITHDLGVIAELTNDVAVMYAGQFVELGSVEDIFNAPQHPYTIALLQSQPDMSGKTVQAIQGQPPSIYEKSPGCAFASRCSLAEERCFTEKPSLHHMTKSHAVSCFLVN